MKRASFVRAVIEEAQGPSAGGRVVDHLGHHAVVVAEIEFVAYTDLAGRVHYDIPQPLLPVEFAQQEHHDVGACLFFLAQELGREDLGVVEHEAVALAEVFYDVLEPAVFYFSAVLVEHHQAAFVPPLDVSVDFWHQLCGYAFLGQVEIEL